MAALPGFLMGPLLYMAMMSLVGLRLTAVPASVAGTVAAGAMGSVLALLALARSARVPLGRDLSARVGLIALGGALAIGSFSEAGRALAPLHAALLLAAAGALGEAFASVVEPRLTDVSVLVTAGLCLALFDGWSVLFGPAASAVAGGFLQRLLLEVPAPGGPQRFLGISDLVIIALLVGLARLRGWGTARAWAAGLIGLELALVQAVVTRHAAPALPAIGLAFCALHWNWVRPNAAGWKRTGRWAAGSTVALFALTVVLNALHSTAP